STQQHWGGGEALLWSLGGELRQSGHSVGWIVRRDSEVQEHLRSRAAPVLHAIQGRGLNVRDWLAIRRSLRGWVPDIVLLNDSHAVPLVGSATWFCRRPRPLRLAYKHTIFPLRSPLKYRLLSDKLVCVSEAARQTVVQGGLAAKRAVVIHGGCQLPQPTADARASVRQELGLEPDEPLLVCVGNLLACKGHGDLLNAMELLHRRHPKLRLVIAGRGEEQARLQRQIDRLGLGQQVQLLGYRDDAQRLLEAADLVVHPSHAEGLSLVLIGAQMLCQPIVATAVGGAQEVLGFGTPQCSSWIAEPHSPRSLAEQITAALRAIEHDSDALHGKLAATAERMRTDFTIQSAAEKLSQLAAQLLSHR
ncbi:MAG: glycosyltransferase family 4 protein, partial [Planctomycetales bacterium]|nr:glycosyltransferase family 4 protein [Planctomycetales bacterium]